MHSYSPRVIAFLSAITLVSTIEADGPPLPSWNDGPARRAIVEFVARVSDPASGDFKPAAERIAVFDNDGTLWSEQPLYVQLAFVVDRVKELAPSHPEWKDQQPFKAVLEGNLTAVAASGKPGLMKLLAATHAGITEEEFAAAVGQWLETARHPQFDRPYTECVYQPMLELLGYLRANGFKTYIVSGGGVQFMRVFAEEVYGVPPEQVIGSSFTTVYEEREPRPVLVRQPEIGFIDDREGKPVAINLHIGRRPLLAFGNSDGDFEMLRYTTTGSGPRLGMIVHHTDADREHAYDRGSPLGRLERGLDEAAANGWIVVDMKQEWKRVFPER